jgi:hypothetical protein
MRRRPGPDLIRSAFPQVRAYFKVGGGCGIRTREGLHPTRFPNPQTEVHVGLYFSVYACEAIAQTLPDGHNEDN